MRAMTEPIAAAQSDAGTGSSWRPGAKPELVHRPQPHVLHADRARTDELERIDIHALDVGSLAGGRPARASNWAAMRCACVSSPGGPSCSSAS